MFIGYPNGVKGYKLWYKEGSKSRVMISRYVTFREDQMYMEENTRLIEKVVRDEDHNKKVKVEFTDGSNQKQDEFEPV